VLSFGLHGDIGVNTATSLATYSALRLARRARAAGKPVAIVNVGGVRDEEDLVAGIAGDGEHGARVDLETDLVLPALVDAVKRERAARAL